jgi:hypothetical protein
MDVSDIYLDMINFVMQNEHYDKYHNVTCLSIIPTIHTNWNMSNDSKNPPCTQIETWVMIQKRFLSCEKTWGEIENRP